MINHPCQSCGACCAFFKVSFHWSETLSESFAVPVAATLTGARHQRVMSGSELVPSRCDSLSGVVAEKVNCGIYENRPSPCRNFAASYEDGTLNLRCDEARAQYGLAALQISDWPLQVAPIL